jgi:hypothetical protein
MGAAAFPGSAECFSRRRSFSHDVAECLAPVPSIELSPGTSDGHRQAAEFDQTQERASSLPTSCPAHDDEAASLVNKLRRQSRRLSAACETLE